MNDKDGTSGANAEEAGVRVEMVLGLITFAVARGLPQERILKVAGLSHADLFKPNARVRELDLHTIWKLLGDHCPDEAIALQLARVAPLSDFGVLTHTARYAENLRAVFRLFTRYSAVIAESLVATLIDGPEVTFLRLHHPLDEIDGGHAAEMAMALIARLGHESLDARDALVGIEFRHAPHGPPAQYPAALKVPCRFECPHNALVFRTEDLEQTLQHGDRNMLAYLQNHLELVRERLTSARDSGELARVRAAVAANAERGEYGADALATRLGTSLRTLQRQVREHGTAVGVLLEEAREANARQLLRDRRLSVEEIAFLLGYSSARAFRRACLRWTGTTPGKLRHRT